METNPPPDRIHSPHDKLIKAGLGRTDVFADFLAAFVPEFGRIMNRPTLRREPEHFVDAHLTERTTDLLFSVEVEGQTVLPYLLFEHSSKADRQARFRLLEYAVRIWSWWRKSRKPRSGAWVLPPIVPVVLYSGKTPWKHSTEFAELVGSPPGVLGEGTPHFRHQLVDLSRLSLDEVQAAVSVKMILGAMKAAANREVMQWMKDAVPMWEEMLRQKSLVSLVETILWYCFECDERESYSTIQALAGTVTSHTTRNQIMSLAEKIRQQGREEAREEARQEVTSLAEKIKQQGREEARQEVTSLAEKIKQQGRREGRQEGMEVGALIGRIQTYQDLLNEPSSGKEALVRLSVSELRRLAQKLQSRLRRQK